MNKYGNGNCKHDVWVANPKDEEGLHLHPQVKSPAVMLANDDDSFYATEFNSWAEINDLIDQIRKCAAEAFGEEPK